MNSINRRTFLKTGGALVVTFSLAPESIFSQRLDGASSNQIDGWLAINGDGFLGAGNRYAAHSEGSWHVARWPTANADCLRLPPATST